MNRLIACIQAYNEESMIKYSLPSVYNDCDEIILIDGAVEGWFPTIHSTDDTVEIAKSLDVDKKLTVVQKDTYWKSLEELKAAFTKYVEIGDFYVIVDADEVYMEGDLTKLRKIIQARPNYHDYIPIFYEMYGSLRYCMRPQPNKVNLTCQRIVRNRAGHTWAAHHPTMADSMGRDTVFDPMYESGRVVVPDMNIFHLSWVKSKEFLIEKHSRYYQKFEGNPPALAMERATKKVEEAGRDLLEYTGPLPKVLLDHPMNKNTMDTSYPNYLSCVEYSHPELIPPIYNVQWSPASRTSVVIAAYKSPELLDSVLDAWEAQLYPDFEIIVVDDGSPSDYNMREVVEKHSACGKSFKYLYNDSGESYCIGGARNIGIWNSSGSRIIFTDADCIPEPQFIMEHMIAGEHNNIVVGPRSHVPSDTTSVDDIESRVTSTDPRLEDQFIRIDKGMMFDVWESVWGCNFSVSKSALLKINGFDEEYDGNWGAEDVDLAYRLIKMGYKARPVPAALVYHIDHPSRNQGGQRELLNKKMGTDPVRGRPKSWS